MAKITLPPQSVLLQLLRYEPATGKLFWKERSVEMFPALRNAKRWNTIYAGQEAFTGRHVHGYSHGRIDGTRYTAHRVIWKIHTGKEPGEIDHINGIRDDNRIENLRVVTRTENSQNRARHGQNTSGVAGVLFHKASQKWLAKIGVGNKSVHIGLFDEFDDAVAARKSAEIEHGFHQNHGRSSLP